MSIEIRITPTGKGFSPKSRWQHLSTRPERVAFDTMADAKAYLKDRYGSRRRQPMYADFNGDDGPKARQVGYIYGFRNADLSHYPVDRWLQQDWVEFVEVTPVELDS